jgi:putative iron-only hydrogenase system regulator
MLACKLSPAVLHEEMGYAPASFAAHPEAMMGRAVLGVVSVIIEDPETNARGVNEILGEHKDLVRGRLGLPFQNKNLGVIVVVVEGELDIINALTGNIGRLPKVSVKATFPPGF